MPAKAAKTTTRHPSVSAKAEKNLRLLQQYILDEPRRFDMADWLQSGYEPGAKREITFYEDPAAAVRDAAYKAVENPPCGTIGCLAGNALLAIPAGRKRLKAANAFELDKKTGIININYDNVNAEGDAIEVLGITEAQAENLFYLGTWAGNSHGWGKKYSHAYEKASTPLARAKVAAKVIDRFIATGDTLAPGESRR